MGGRGIFGEMELHSTDVCAEQDEGVASTLASVCNDIDVVFHAKVGL